MHTLHGSRHDRQKRSYHIPKNHISHEHPGAPWNWIGYGSSSSTSFSSYSLLSKTRLRLCAFISVLDLLTLKNVKCKQLLMCTKRHCDRKWNTRKSQNYSSVFERFYFIFIFLLDKHIYPWKWSTSEFISPLWAQWGEVLVSTPCSLKSIRLLFGMKYVIIRGLWSMTNDFSYSYFLLSFIAII